MKKKVTYGPSAAVPAAELREMLPALPASPKATAEPMVRTQIYLSRAQHDFLESEAGRSNQPMAAVIRGLIDERMRIPEDAWTHNPLLAPAPEDPEWQGREDGALNHDHYIYGSPKKYVQVNGEWVPAPPLPEGYYDQPRTEAAGPQVANRKRR